MIFPRSFQRSLGSVSLAVAILGLGSGTGGCMSLRPHEKSVAVIDSNGVVAHISPSFDNSVTWLGWTTIVAATAGGAFGGYASDAALRWDGWERPEREIPLGNAAIGAVAGFWSSLCLTYLVGGGTPAVTRENEELWVRKLDDDLLLVPTASGSPSATGIRTIRRDADERFTIRSIADAELFRATFPESPFTDRVVGRAVTELDRRDLPRLAELFAGTPSSLMAQARFVSLSDSLEEAIGLSERYPDVADVARTRAAGLVRSIEQVRRYREAFPHATADSIALVMAGAIDRRDLPKLADVFGGGGVTDDIARIYVDRSSTVDEAIDAATRYPSHAASAEERAASVVRSVDDAERFLAAFPTTTRREQLAERLVVGLERTEIPAYLELFPSSSRTDLLKQRYVGEAPTVREVVDAARRFPAHSGLAEQRASHLATSIEDFRAYLQAFPDGGRAQEVAKAIDRDLSTIVPLGPEINTEYSELLPIVAPDGKTLYFSRRYYPGNTGGSSDPDDIWFSVQDSNGHWLKATGIGDPLNRETSDHTGSVTPDGNTLVLGNTYDYSAGISVTHRTATGWSYPTTLEIENYYNASEYINYFMANDGRTLIFAVRRADTRGIHDLYVSFQKDDGTWSSPMNLGPTINTSGREDSPFLAADGQTLYFSSDGHKGHGDRDIFMSRRLDKSWKRWSKPVNLGADVNSAGDDSFFFIPASGDYAYFSRTNPERGDADIVRIGVPKHARPQPVVLLAGRILDRNTKQPLAAKIYYETLADGKRIGEARSDPSTGSYKITLPAGAVYGFRAEADGFVAISDNVDLTRLAFYSEESRDLYLVPMEAGQTIRMNNLFFDVGKASLRRESIPELERLVGLLRRNEAMTIEITGHTDDVGSDENNLALSQSRADAVRAFMIGKGVPEQRVAAVGKGEAMPVEPNTTDEGRQRNRRVEFTIVSK
jgi:OOP family OmpA-OmpF porin